MRVFRTTPLLRDFLIVLAVLTLVLIALYTGLTQTARADNGGVGSASPGVATGSKLLSLFGSAVTTGTTAITSSAVDVSDYHSLDVFIKTDLTDNTGTVTATLQISPDGTNWFDHTFLIDSGSSVATITQQRVLSNDDSDVIVSAPVAGRYARLSLTRTNDGLTPTGWFLLKNSAAPAAR